MIAYCDNAAVVAVLNGRYSKETNLMQMLRCLFFIEAYFQFTVMARHVAGVRNEIADDLSRNRLASFRSKLFLADDNPSPIPSSLVQWLLRPEVAWTCPSWIQQFTTFVHMV